MADGIRELFIERGVNMILKHVAKMMIGICGLPWKQGKEEREPAQQTHRILWETDIVSKTNALSFLELGRVPLACQFFPADHFHDTSPTLNPSSSLKLDCLKIMQRKQRARTESFSENPRISYCCTKQSRIYLPSKHQRQGSLRIWDSTAAGPFLDHNLETSLSGWKS